MEKSTPLRFYDFIKDFEFDYLNTLPEKAWKDLEKAYTCHLNTVEQTEAVKKLKQMWETTRKHFQNGFIDIYLQMREKLVERKVQADSHKVACHTISANVEKVGKNIISWTKTATNDNSQNPFYISSILMKEDEAVVNDNGRKRKLKDYESIRTPKNNIAVLNDNEGDKQKEFALSIESNKKRNYDGDILSAGGTIVSSEDINNILENIKANYEEKDELTDNDVERSLAEADIINISSDNPPINRELFNRLKEKAHSQPPPRIKIDGLKKWIQENYARKITTTISNIRSVTTIENFDAKQAKKLDLLMDENTYTSTIVSPDFEILKFCFPKLFISRWNENDVPSSKWRREIVYRDSNASARKADGILFNYRNITQEFLLFENIGPPLKTQNPKYNGDLLKCFRNSVDSICKTFWNGNGDIKFAKKYYVLAYVLYKDKGELFRLNLGAPKTFVAERILTVNYPFEYSTFPCIVSIIDLLFTVKAIFESNVDVLHDYSKSCMEISKNFTPVREWLSLNRNSL
ncbi:30036_t:CDS:10 [Racocetra persica]|uniref:30036_t:CDS:1 n=1 Tax=Racocetra persica TaxID=160502 RepID=A0ACA9MB60_9GLOM|nr:30036_t:CDS:10 [Racocetra persica]